jgi:hypothetical protein
MEAESCDELDLGIDLGVIGTACTDNLGKKIVNQNEGETQGAHGALLFLLWYCLRWEIRR